MSVTADAELVKITDTDLLLDDEKQDVRGRKVIDRHGATVGHVSNLFVDVDKRKVRLLEIRTTGLPGFWRHALLPVDAVTSVGAHEIRIDQTREGLDHSPGYSPQLVPMPTREYWEPFYGYYGLSPYWGDGYFYPGFPLSLEQQPVVDAHSLHARDL
jgi:sporulation protein YlmC with PRC-barrel domain